MDSLSTVLSQEMLRFNKLLVVMRKSLIELGKAIRGEVLMDDTLDHMYTSFLINKVPTNWENAAYPSLKPLGSWMKDLESRIAFMRKWLEKGPPNVYALSFFFFPQGYMTGVLQNHARKYKLPIDALNFNFAPLKEMDPEKVETAPDDGVYVGGLYFDGARWDAENMLLVESEPGVMFSPGPIVHFTPTDNFVPSPVHYSCPVYKTGLRQGALSTTGMSTNFVVAVELPTTKDPDFWVLQGVAFLCQLNE